MIGPDDRKTIEELQAKVQCAKGFTCTQAALSDLCAGKYHLELDIMECLEKGHTPCKFARSFGCTLVCVCPLRKLIARNFARWSADDTTVLREAWGAKEP